MPKFLIERNMPGAGKRTPAQVREAASKSNVVIREVAPSEDVIREHALCTGVPADRISKVSATIDPAVGE
jgi:hypothetical protein